MVEEIVLGSPLLWYTILLPIIAGTFSLVAGKALSPKAHAGINGLAWLFSLIAITALIPLVYGGFVVVDPVAVSIPLVGVFALFVDGVSIVMALSIAAVSLAVAVYSYRYMEHRFEELGIEQWGLYYFLYQLFTAGMLGVVYANNTILFYLFLELTLIPSFLLIALYGYGDRVRIALLYLVWTHVGAGLFLLGVILVGFTAGFTYYEPGYGYITGIGEQLAINLQNIAFMAIVLGLAIKAALFGFHIWLPYAHAEAPTPVSALLSPLLIGLGIYGLLRVAVGFFPSLWISLTPIFIAWSFITMIYGGLLAYTQDDVKRFLAYSSVSQMGYLFLGLATMSHIGFIGSILHYVSHAVGKAILFAVAGILIVLVHTRDMRSMGGLAQKLNYTASLALIGFLFLVGIPPTLGLLSEYLIARGLAEWALEYSPQAFIVVLAAFIAAVAVSTIYSFVGFRRIFLGKPGPAFTKAKAVEHPSLVIPLLFLAALGIVLFLFPEPFVAPMKMVMATLVGGA